MSSNQASLSNVRVRVMSHHRVWECVINPNQNLLDELHRQTRLTTARFMYDGDWITAKSTIRDLQLQPGTIIDAFIPATHQTVAATEMVAHLSQEGLDPSRFSYYGDGNIALSTLSH